MTAPGVSSGDFALRGVGVHSGALGSVQMAGRAAFGLPVIARGGCEWPLDHRHLATDCRRATDLVSHGQKLRTVEHLLSALCAVGLPALCLEVSGEELPILDGSAWPYLHALHGAGHRGGFAFVELEREIVVSAHGGTARLRPTSPCEEPVLSVRVDLGTGAPRFNVVEFWPLQGDYEREIAPARTFVKRSDVASLRAGGLIQGGSLDCALVLDEHGPVVGQAYRLPDEPVRHKVLDAIGDLALLGGLPRAIIELERPGHALLHEVVRAAAPFVRQR